MDETTLSTLGIFSTELLSDERFEAMCKLYSQQCAVDMLNTEAHEAKKREGIYAAYQGFEGFLALLKDFAQKATQPPKPQHEDAYETTGDIDDPSVHDIYRTELN